MSGDSSNSSTDAALSSLSHRVAEIPQPVKYSKDSVTGADEDIIISKITPGSFHLVIPAFEQKSKTLSSDCLLDTCFHGYDSLTFENEKTLKITLCP